MSNMIYRVYLDDDLYDPHEDFATYEEAEAFRIELASSRAEGACEDRHLTEYDRIAIEKINLDEENARATS